MIDVLFDQYQRYQNVTDIINSLRKTGQVFNILEVGANEHQNLEKFLPNDQITYLDIQLPEHLKDNPQYILGDATAMDFANNHYHIVVALDVFEHIFEEDRDKFIDELYRVSSDFFVITAPFHSDLVVEAERRVNAVYRSIFSNDFIWLEEHRSNGLPKIEKLIAHLKFHQLPYSITSHGDIQVWERMMNIHFIAAQDSRLSEYRKEMDIFYNSHIYKNDYGDLSYRKICVVSKTVDLAYLPSRHVDLQERNSDMETFYRMEQTFLALSSIPPVVAPPTDFLQLFLDEGMGFFEDGSLKVINNKQHFRIELNNRKLKSIRIDPSNFKGTFRIDNIRLHIEDSGILKEEDYMITGNYLHNFRNNYLFIEDDPCIVMYFKTETSINQISFDCMPLHQEDSSASLIDYFTEIMLQKEEQERRKVNAFDIERRQLNDAINAVEGDLNNLKMEYNTLSDDYINNMRAYDEILTAHDELKSSHNELRTAHNELKFKYDQSELQIEGLKTINHELVHSIQEVQLINDDREKELNSIYSSRGWTYLTKIKRVLRK
ncbi:class I SAM-dependent methyltransferase [Gorillibacterium timonense]|uniref:class I SAM-dependent methyltransferase n=1 Tax=Gorillibacterium timonense TaxID=1689269 RepID=UPI00071C2987|nr:class I SAM-dependent methyltransferase [Gorillibacterium timonense]